MSSRQFGFLVVVVVLLLSVGSAQAQTGMRHGGGGGIGFGMRIAGAWLGSGEFSVDLGCDGLNNATNEPGFDFGPIPFTDTQLFGSAGTRAVTNPANPNTGLGTWTQTGRRQISGRDVVFGVDSTPGGMVTSVSIISITVDFDHDYQTATTHFGAKVYAPGVDPLDPASPLLACSDGVHTSFTKVNATE